ncbi:hypothetical protein GCM10009828_043410 [Actinoplanes couchii]|uniref:Uncharacterized protein n=1 Tax=Actinoplanes couchii TaxID=403638 RepID=A0ABQ3XDG6_9ACTN|nr:hypothetical protein Aco03nite_049120 [Actinoplanes couchii]
MAGGLGVRDRRSDDEVVVELGMADGRGSGDVAGGLVMGGGPNDVSEAAGLGVRGESGEFGGGDETAELVERGEPCWWQ